MGLGLVAVSYGSLVAWSRQAWVTDTPVEELASQLRGWMVSVGLPTRHHYLDTPAGRVHVLEAGQGESVVVLLPGLAASAGEFWRLIKALGSRHRVVAIDRPGTGLSEQVRFQGHPREPWIAVIEAVADQLGLDAFILVGHSVGGLAAGAFASRHPGRVRRLVLLSPLGLEQRIPLLWNLMLLPGIGEMVAAADRLRRTRLVSRQPTTSGELRPESSPSPMAAYRLGVGLRFGPGSDFSLLPRLLRPLGLRRQSLLLPDLGPVTDRTLVVWGRRDRELPLAGTRAAWRRRPGLSLTVVEGEGHSLPFAKPQLLAQLIGKD